MEKLEKYCSIIIKKRKIFTYHIIISPFKIELSTTQPNTNLTVLYKSCQIISQGLFHLDFTPLRVKQSLNMEIIKFFVLDKIVDLMKKTKISLIYTITYMKQVRVPLTISKLFSNSKFASILFSFMKSARNSTEAFVVNGSKLQRVIFGNFMLNVS